MVNITYVILSAKSRLILGENKTGFRCDPICENQSYFMREGHIYNTYINVSWQEELQEDASDRHDIHYQSYKNRL